MNQLQFRVFDNKFKRMSLPFSFKDITGKWGCIDFRDDRGLYGLPWEGIEEEPDRFIIMQYTGLKDKQGKMIFEDDILHIDGRNEYRDEEYQGIFQVNYELSDWGYEFSWDNISGYECSTHIMGETDEINSPNIEILGNVHEHKHLLNSSLEDKCS